MAIIYLIYNLSVLSLKLHRKVGIKNITAHLFFLWPVFNLRSVEPTSAFSLEFKMN